MYTRGIVFGLALLSALTTAARGQDHAGDRQVSTAVPAISIQTSVPSEINLGTATRVMIAVRNSGKSPAEGVSIQTTLPETVKFVQANPAPSMTSEQLIQFEIGDLAPGAERRISIDLIPQRQGPVDLQTRAFFSASTQSALQVRRPQIAIDCQGPEQALLGETISFSVVVKNVGDGSAQDVVLKPALPSDSHVAAQLPSDAKLTTLGPGASKEYRFLARATEGQWLEADFTVSSRDGQETHCGKRVRILRADLEVEITGPQVSFLNKAADYQLRVWNPGDTTLDGGMVALAVPDGLQLTALSKEAHLDTESRMLTWCLAKMAPGESQSLMLKATAVKAGAQLQKAVATSGPQLTAQADHLTLVIARPDVDVAVFNRVEAVEVGVAELFTIVVKNNGSKTAEAVDVQALLPDSLTSVESDAYRTAGQQLSFPQLRLTPGEEKHLKFQATSLTAGEHAVRAAVQTEYATLPTIAETTVYFFDDVELDRVGRAAGSSVIVR